MSGSEKSFDAGAGGTRLDRFLAERAEGLSREHWKDLILRGRVRVDGRPRDPSYRLRPGERVTVRVEAAPWADEVPFEDWVAHEDKDILVLRKPPGLLIHPLGVSWLRRPEAALDEPEPSLAGLLLLRRPDAARSGVVRCGIVHRLDRQTSGVLVVAKTPAAQEILTAAFRERLVVKVYRAVVLGELEARTRVEAPIGRAPGRRRVRVSAFGREARTDFRALETARGLSLVQAEPKTGRTHQIRAHLAHLGHPVLGDAEAFGAAERERFDTLGLPPPPRMLLHAYRLKFDHPRGGRPVSFSAPVPKDFRDYWRRVRD